MKLLRRLINWILDDPEYDYKVNVVDCHPFKTPSPTREELKKRPETEK